MSDEYVFRSSEIVLRPPKPSDVVDRLALGRVPEIFRMFGGDTSNPLPPLTTGEVSEWLHRINAHPHAWIVEHQGRLLGEARLDSLTERDRRARLAIGFFDPTKLGQGLGRQVVRLVLHYAFEYLRLHRVDLHVLAYNVRAIRCYRSCGFIEEGREREAALIAGERHDDIIMGILAHEYFDIVAR